MNNKDLPWPAQKSYQCGYIMYMSRILYSSVSHKRFYLLLGLAAMFGFACPYWVTLIHTYMVALFLPLERLSHVYTV